WSSDVCSSDLVPTVWLSKKLAPREITRRAFRPRLGGALRSATTAQFHCKARYRASPTPAPASKDRSCNGRYDAHEVAAPYSPVPPHYACRLDTTPSVCDQPEMTPG